MATTKQAAPAKKSAGFQGVRGAFCLFLIRNLFFLWDKNLSHSHSLVKNTYSASLKRFTEPERACGQWLIRKPDSLLIFLKFTTGSSKNILIRKNLVLSRQVRSAYGAKIIAKRLEQKSKTIQNIPIRVTVKNPSSSLRISPESGRCAYIACDTSFGWAMTIRAI